MRVTVCELPHEPSALAVAWSALCAHTWQHESELVLLPELAMVEPLWEYPAFDAGRWAAAEALSNRWIQLLRELHAEQVVGTRPVSMEGRRYNEGYIWSAAAGLVPLRRKYFFPNEPGGWEARWFDRGDAEFPAFHAGDVSFGLNICSEMWALETYGGYANQHVQLILSPRATAAATTAKWLSSGVVAAVRSGAFSLSSNRVDPTGTYGGAAWIVSPDGAVLATTSSGAPFATVDIDLVAATAERASYPRYVFSEGSR